MIMLLQTVNSGLPQCQMYWNRIEKYGEIMESIKRYVSYVQK